jgi:cell filamentation protein
LTDPYLSPSGRVLRNRLNCETQADLDDLEAAVASVREEEILAEPVAGRFDLRHLCRVHEALFRDVYDWAGQTRNLNIDKGVPFADFRNIDSYASTVFSELSDRRFLADLSREDFVDGLTWLLSEINAIHPFREGNGRTQRAFLRQLAREAGYDLDWSSVDRDANIAASVQSLLGNDDLLRELLNEVVRPLGAE